MTDKGAYAISLALVLSAGMLGGSLYFYTLEAFKVRYSHESQMTLVIDGVPVRQTHTSVNLRTDGLATTASDVMILRDNAVSNPIGYQRRSTAP